jgi:hypothetical protein
MTMPGPFNVTAASDSLRLDAQRQGAITFTVSNASGRPRRGRARLVPGDPAQASWLKLEGEAERDFAADGTHQLTVRVAVPAEVPPGRFTFGLDVVSVENPDEEFTQGPKVAAEIPRVEVKKPFPWWILAVAAGLLLVLGLTAWLLLRDKGPVDPEVPDKPAGAPLQASCQKEGDCAASLACTGAAEGQAGVCLGTLGFATCRRTEDCVAGLTCDGGTCRGGLRFAACGKAEDCAEGLTCEGGSCLGAKGFASCAAKADCVPGLSCVNGTCTDRTILARCNADTDCVDGEACVQVGSDRLCLRRTGQSCGNSLECVARNCVGDTCQPGKETCLAQADCASPFQCISGNCLLGNGQACGSNLECQSGNCNSGVCASVPIPCRRVRPSRKFPDGRYCPSGMICGADGMCEPEIKWQFKAIEIQPGILSPGIRLQQPPPQPPPQQ